MKASTSIRKGLPAMLFLAAAAFASATQAQELRRMDPEIGHQIAEQGNRALRAIHAETRAAVKHLSPVRNDYAVVPFPLKLAQGLHKDRNS